MYYRKPGEFLMVNMHDPVLMSQLTSAGLTNIDSYLIALAAFQRGLSVSFHRFTSTEEFHFKSDEGYLAELFSVTDGRHTHYFNRTIGDLTPPELSVITTDKHRTKERLQKHGIPVPVGIVANKGQQALVEKFIRISSAREFVVKPFDGSLSRDVRVGVPPAELLSCVQEHPDARVVIEEQIKGDEYRVSVVDGKAVAITQALQPHVIGDGVRTIEELVAEKNRSRVANPVFRYLPLKITPDMVSYLAAGELTTLSVPEPGQRVILSHSFSIHQGGDIIEVTDAVSSEVKEVAIRACEAFGMLFAGVDVIERRQGGKTEVYVLELNSRGSIEAHSYPLAGEGRNNTVAEAIIDRYFPDSIHNRRFPEAVINVKGVLEALQNGLFSSVTLPTLASDWVHKRIKLGPESGDRVLRRIKYSFLRHKLYGLLHKTDTGEFIFDCAGPEADFQDFMKMFSPR
ncbi:MAG: ATP-grasp domain-containing protein [Chlorobiaceae bacterium]|nr:ATP-grasp domain-containing protein [Chlorobiaceae bacterium]